VCDFRMKDGPGKNARAHKTMYRGIHVWLWLWLSGVVGRGEGELDGGTVVADGKSIRNAHIGCSRGQAGATWLVGHGQVSRGNHNRRCGIVDRAKAKMDPSWELTRTAPQLRTAEFPVKKESYTRSRPSVLQYA
jgi:hypothetical protein